MPLVPVTHSRLPRTTEGAKDLRREMTPAESLLWKHLRGRKLSNLKFRRQHPLGHFIADFFCREARLVVEVDGGIHKHQRGYDAQRDDWMRSQGYCVVRLPNDLVLNDPEAALRALEDALVAACGAPALRW